MYKKAITESTHDVCGNKVIGGNKKRTAWCNDIEKQKVKGKKDAWKKYLANKSREDMEAYKLKRKEAKDEVRKSKQQAVKRCRRGNQCPIKHVKNKQGDVV